ncbi:MAG: SufD family Fe-S cluster assembly protein, partial [Cyanobacteria bacterium P01_E01_bin.48]
MSKPAIVVDSPAARTLANLLDQTSALDTALNAERAAWLESIRQAARDRLRHAALPTIRDEDWRFTNLKPLYDLSFQPSEATLEAAQIQSFYIPEATGARLVFFNGKFAPHLSDLSELPAGIAVDSLAHLSEAEWQVARSHFTLDAMGQADSFALLNAAQTGDMAVIRAAKNCIAAAPIHLLWVSSADSEPSVSYPRCLVVAEQSSAINVVEHFIGVGDRLYFANTVTEIALAGNARVEHSKLLQDNSTSFNVTRTAISQARDSYYACHAIAIGAKLSRHSLTAEHRGPNATTVLNGLTLAHDKQLADTHTSIDHAVPQGTSQQLHKCIIGDRARAVFNGRVIVRPDAQQIDSSQSSRNLLLSPKARVDTKPQLEIFADDVKCAHGAT